MKENVIPDPLEGVGTAEEWKNRRRDILALYNREVYGHVPDFDFTLETEKVFDKEFWEAGPRVAGPRQRLFKTRIKADGGELFFHTLLFTPGGGETSPLFLGLNFNGVHTVVPDPDLPLPKSPPGDTEGARRRFSQVYRGCAASRWPVHRALERGYGIATVFCGDFDPDFHDGFKNGVHRLAPRRAGQWGTISAWAWGLSRALDVLVATEGVDPSRIAALGHSRLGKTALWAAARDERFCLAVSNDSGCGGASLFRGNTGESVTDITTRFPHWFNENFWAYRDNHQGLPLDQHWLLSLIAPRPLYVASAMDDAWACPPGEFRAAYLAGPVYQLLGGEGLASPVPPPVNEPVTSRSLAYHVREGGHDITAWDWERFMDFRDRLGI